MSLTDAKSAVQTTNAINANLSYPSKLKCYTRRFSSNGGCIGNTDYTITYGHVNLYVTMIEVKKKEQKTESRICPLGRDSAKGFLGYI